MNIAQIENNIKTLVANLASGELATDNFIYELLLAYGHRSSTVSMLKNGHYNIAKEPGEIIFKRHLYFKQMQGDGLHTQIDEMKNQKLVTVNRTRFVIVTNFDHLLAVDTKTGDSLDIPLAELPKQFDFFLPWAGMEKAVYQGENPADVKAAEKMAKLFDLIKADNFTEETQGDKAKLHNLNVFLTRVLFCFFAEDTEIFTDNQFSSAIESHTNTDGKDVADYLNRLFEVLNTADADRDELPEYLASFPYVNGGLFADNIPSPHFSRKSRRILIECGSELNWSDINPDIFGSMIQAAVHPDQRGGMGMHYTSVTNIMKLIEPLFLNDLYEELDKVSNSATKLQKLQQRLGEIKIFDPACGSGNFLIIAYKELRRLETELLKRWQKVEQGKTGQVLQAYSVIKLSQFYGIELDDFAHEVAILSLWLAEHQMNVEFKTEFGESVASLPLKKSATISCGNALMVEWSEFCGKGESAEVFLMGNPPYVSFKGRTKDQKEDMSVVFADVGGVKRLDYVGCWFKKAVDYIGDSARIKFAFVATNSICQGEQVSLIWPYIFDNNKEIFFAFQSFNWANNAKSNASVTCVIVGIQLKNKSNKYIFSQERMMSVESINPYLVEGNDVVIYQKKRPLSDFPKMAIGSTSLDGGRLILSEKDRIDFISADPVSEKFIKPYVGGDDVLKGTKRYCLWIEDEDVQEAKSIILINERIAACRDYRENSGRDGKKGVNVSHRFYYRKFQERKESIVLTTTNSQRREYMPVALCPPDVVHGNSLIVGYDVDMVVFGILMSKMQMVWMRAVAGRLQLGLRYSVNLIYNNFPFPEINENSKKMIENTAMGVLAIREAYPEFNLQKLYNPDTMPADLANAHKLLDEAVDSCYSKKKLNNESERLTILFQLFEIMTGVQNA